MKLKIPLFLVHPDNGSFFLSSLQKSVVLINKQEIFSNLPQKTAVFLFQPHNPKSISSLSMQQTENKRYHWGIQIYFAE